MNKVNHWHPTTFLTLFGPIVQMRISLGFLPIMRKWTANFNCNVSVNKLINKEYIFKLVTSFDTNELNSNNLNKVNQCHQSTLAKLFGQIFQMRVFCKVFELRSKYFYNRYLMSLGIYHKYMSTSNLKKKIDKKYA